MPDLTTGSLDCSGDCLNNATFLIEKPTRILNAFLAWNLQGPLGGAFAVQTRSRLS